MNRFFFSVWSYRHRSEQVKADLNKLYDVPAHPTTHTQHSDGGMGVDYGGTDPAKAPSFDLEFSGNVTAVLGKRAILNCRVRDIGNKTVSSVLK